VRKIGRPGTPTTTAEAIQGLFATHLIIGLGVTPLVEDCSSQPSEFTRIPGRAISASMSASQNSGLLF